MSEINLRQARVYPACATQNQVQHRHFQQPLERDFRWGSHRKAGRGADATFLGCLTGNRSSSRFVADSLE